MMRRSKQRSRDFLLGVTYVGMNASIPNASPSNQVAVWSNVRGILFRCACNFSASAVHQIHCICQVAWTPLGLLVEFLAAATTSQFAACLEISVVDLTLIS
jgi:hypothetical protein